ncbi:uncharacterized protein K02A2.6-like [Ruditapes philippinarum]|uniref:uncharacterized protein K02A2.6-like n=1 Tax=Ruditapes philippinarum TaxID=129788 RepID=UPI00295BF24B|nr:uncharacterized protein K02A2.6-like [Ruditapes philippinarum]
MAKLQPPENFDFSSPNKWNNWKQRFSFYRTASKLHKEDGDIQVATLVYTMGKEADNLLKSFELSESSSKYATGSVVLQKQDNGDFKPVSFASRTFTPTELSPVSQLQKKRLEEIKSEQKSDYVCSKLIEYTYNGWPSTESCEIAKLYKPYRSEITVNKGLLMRNDRLIIPTDMRLDILSKLHQAHQGIARAKESVWWKCISRDIQQLIQNCDICAKFQNDKREPMISTPFPRRSWSRLGSDLFHWRGHTYLLVVDYFSRYIELSRLTSTSSMAVVEHFKSILSRHGLCDTIVSYGGLQNTSDVFRQFCLKYGIEHVTSSPRYPLGNSEADRAVNTVKRLLSKCDDPYEAMTIYRATPLPHNGLSPSQMLFGRRIKTTLPQAPQKLLPSNIN